MRLPGRSVMAENSLDKQNRSPAGEDNQITRPEVAPEVSLGRLAEQTAVKPHKSPPPVVVTLPVRSRRDLEL